MVFRPHVLLVSLALLLPSAALGTDAPASFETPLLNVEGIPFAGTFPPDPIGDIGPEHYVQAVNSTNGTFFSVFDKTGVQILPSVLLWQQIPTMGLCSFPSGVPTVLYDREAERWLIAEVTALVILGSEVNLLCVYLSESSDPTQGSWTLYEFPTLEVPDFPRFSISPEAYVVTTNEPGGKPDGVAVYALDRRAMLAGEPASSQRFTGPRLGGFLFQALTPAVRDGRRPAPADSPIYLLRHRDDEAHDPLPDPTRDFIDLFELYVSFDEPQRSRLSGPIAIPISEFDSDLCGLLQFFCFPQPGTNVLLDPIREVLMWRVQYRNFGSHETLVGNLVTDVDGQDHGGIRWFELRKRDGAWRLHQEGTHAPDADNRWVGSIAMDGAGNIALGYTVAGPTRGPSIAYTGRNAWDPSGVLSQGEQSLAEGFPQLGTTRWGDYSSMNVDPEDDCTFWYTNLYYSMPSAIQWTTRIASLRFPRCPPVVAVNRVRELFDRAVADGTLRGRGTGRHAERRLHAFALRLKLAQRFVARERDTAACIALASAERKSDGEGRDLVTGEARPELAEEIEAARAALSCRPLRH